MKYRASFCDPFNQDIIELGDLEEGKILETFEKIPWNDLLEKMDHTKERDIHYSPSLEIENKLNKQGITISAIDKDEWHIFYKRPKKVARFLGLFSNLDNNYISDIPEQKLSVVKKIFNAFEDNDFVYIENKIETGSEYVVFKESRLKRIIESILFTISFILPFVGFIILIIGLNLINNRPWFVSVSYIVLGLIFIIWGNKLPFLKGKVKQKKAQKELLRKKLFLMSNGKKIKVPTSDICISGSVDKVTTEAVAVKNVFGLFAGLLRGTNPAHDVIDYHGTSVLIYRKELQNRTFEFISEPINKQPVTLEFQLSQLENMVLYIDPNDINNYYFDIEVL